MSLDNSFKPDSSFFESEKFGRLSAKREQKASRLLDPPVTAPSLIDMAQSSALREAGDVSDAIQDVGNYLGLADKVQLDEGYSNRVVSDEAAGVTAVQRAIQTQKENQVMRDIANSNWSNLLSSIPDVALGAAADSTGILLGGLAGIGATAAAGAGIGALAGPVGATVGGLAGTGVGLASKANDAYQGVSKLLERYQKIKKGAGKAGKRLSQTSVMIAADTERQIQAYREENDGQHPSKERLATMGVGSAILMAGQFSIGKSFLPKSKEELTRLEKLVRAAKPDKGSARKIVDNLAKGAAKVAATGGAEASQEYLQQWQQMLSKNVNPKEGQSLWDAVKVELQNPENQLEAKVAAAIGFGAGGATKGVTIAPKLGVDVAVDTAVGTAKGVGKVVSGTVHGLLNKSNKNKLSQSDRRDLHNQQQNQETIAKDKTDSLAKQATILEEAETVEDLKADPELRSIIENYQTTENTRIAEATNTEGATVPTARFSNEALQDKTAFAEFKAVLNLGNKEAQKEIDKKLKNSHLSHFKNVTGKPADSFTQAPTELETKEIVDKVTPLGEETIQAASELETKLAIDTVESVTKDPTIVPVEALALAKELSVHDLERVSAIVSTTNPEAAKKLKKLAESKVRALSRFTPSKDKLIDDSNVDRDLVAVAKEGIQDETIVPYLSEAISSTMGKKINSLGVVKTLQGVLDHYENTKSFKEQGKGTIHPATLTKWKKRLAVMERTVKEPKKAEDAKKDETPKETDTAAEETSPTEVEPEEKTATVEESPKLSAKAEEKLKEISEIIDETIKEKGDLTGLVGIVGRVAKGLKGAGLTKNKDLDNFVKQYPAFKKDPIIYNTLKLEMYNPNEEVEADLATKNLTEAEANAAYDKLNPGCK